MHSRIPMHHGILMGNRIPLNSGMLMAKVTQHKEKAKRKQRVDLMLTIA